MTAVPGLGRHRLILLFKEAASSVMILVNTSATSKRFVNGSTPRLETLTVVLLARQHYNVYQLCRLFWK